MERVGRIEAFDGLSVPAEDDASDLAIFSHVVEHVPEPEPLCARRARLAHQVIVEVPLEANRSAHPVGARGGGPHRARARVRAADGGLSAPAGLDVVRELTDRCRADRHASPRPGSAGAGDLRTLCVRRAFRAGRRAERTGAVPFFLGIDVASPCCLRRRPLGWRMADDAFARWCATPGAACAVVRVSSRSPRQALGRQTALTEPWRRLASHQGRRLPPAVRLSLGMLAIFLRCRGCPGRCASTRLRR